MSECTPGHGEQCRHAKSSARTCHCACGGQNHGRAIIGQGLLDHLEGRTTVTNGERLAPALKQLMDAYNKAAVKAPVAKRTARRRLNDFFFNNRYWILDLLEHAETAD